MENTKSYTISPKDAYAQKIEKFIISSVALLPEREGHNFLPIQKDGSLFYGGSQTWWKDIKRQEIRWNKGCGVVAACNYIYYQSLKKPHNLLPHELPVFPCPDASYFLSIMDNMWKKIGMVPFLGGTTQTLLLWSLKKYLRKKGIKTRSAFSFVGSSVKKVRQLIQEGLAKDIPVFMFTNFIAPDNWEHYGANHNMHVMTITKWFQVADGREYLVVSTWGERQIVPLDSYLKWGRIFGFSSFYLEQA